MTEETIFLSAIEKKDATDRAAYLDDACKGDSALRQRIEALLRSHADPDSFLNVPAVARQVQGTDEPARTTDLPSANKKGPAPATNDEPLAFLAPGREPGSLGRLDHYEILEVVGRGGMGVVFKARDTKLHRVVAIKVLAAHLAISGTARQRFFREARAAAAVRDEHVVSIHSVSDEDGPAPYLVMEFIAGVTLENRIKKKGPLTVKEILRIGMQAADGLCAAHRQGLIHRDVKPANILLENGVERVKITDFGLARASDDVNLTQSGLIAGTPLFMSPEQARGETLDQRSDLFSLGSVLYLLCTGQQAFASGNTPAVLKRVCEDTPKPIREINSDIPEWLAALVGKLHAKEAQERFQSAAEVAELLRQHLAQIQQPNPAPPPLLERKESLPSASAQVENGGPVTRKWKRLAVAAVLLGLVAVAASVVTVAFLMKPATKKETLPDDPRVLTVSKNPEDGGRFRTIQAALDEVEPEMTIRVLDDEVYEEYLLINRPVQYCGVVLEAARKATIRKLPGKSESVLIRGVPGFTIRGFSLDSGHDVPHAQIFIGGSCPGVLLDGLDMTAHGDCVNLYEHAEGTKETPIVIQNCTMRKGYIGVHIEGYNRKNRDFPQPCGHVVIRNNTLVGCNNGVVMFGAGYKVHVVGNRFLDFINVAIELYDLLPRTEDILVANNTLLRNNPDLRVWDDHRKGRVFLKCKNIRFQNNLMLEPQFLADMIFFDHHRGRNDPSMPGDLKALLNSPEWHFSHNWREIDPKKVGDFKDRWIPGPNDHLEVPIKVLSRKRSDPNFLRPAKDSPLATGGVNDGSLPAYVGAVPPEGVEAWDWEKTWKATAR